MYRFLTVFVLICFMAAPAAFACVAPRCTTDPASPGYSSCRNVANCGGCMGWTCHGDGIADGDQPKKNEPVLVPVKTTIEVVQPENQ